MPRPAATRRIVTAPVPSASARDTAAAAIAARLCFGLGPRPPYSGTSQIDTGTRARDPGCGPDVVTGRSPPPRSLSTCAVRGIVRRETTYIVRSNPQGPQEARWPSHSGARAPRGPHRAGAGRLDVCDGIMRCGVSRAPPARIPVTGRERAGSPVRGRLWLRIQISGGAHPRFARNTGSGEPRATATRLVPVDCDPARNRGPCALLLPVHPAVAPSGPGRGGRRPESPVAREGCAGIRPGSRDNGFPHNIDLTETAG